ncbi:MAG TPA: hypothetical protein VIM58_09040 [Candidatus Methylacidiphilales bacterium]
MGAPRQNHHLPFRARSAAAFSLMELIVVVTIMAILVVVSMPAWRSLTGTVSSPAVQIAGALQRARTYAMTHNTYVWVGFYEQDAGRDAGDRGAGSPPPYAGRGQVVLGMAASLDGTSIYDDDAAPAALPASRIVPVEKPTRLENVHLADVGAPSASSAGSAPSLRARPSDPYTDTAGDAQRISSESSQATPHPMTVGGYTFYKTVRFSPSGEAVINNASDLYRFGEIGLLPTRGKTVNSQARDVAAIQFSGIGGRVQIYRP